MLRSGQYLTKELYVRKNEYLKDIKRRAVDRILTKVESWRYISVRVCGEERKRERERFRNIVNNINNSKLAKIFFRSNAPSIFFFTIKLQPIISPKTS